MASDDNREASVVGFPDGVPRISRGRRWFLWVFSIAMVITAGTAFIFKLIDFFYTATHGGPDAMGSFLVPVLNYLLVAGGFVCLFLWAYFTGQFRDVEGPKYRMLQMQGQIDRQPAPGKKV